MTQKSVTLAHLGCVSYPWGQSDSPPVSPHLLGPWGEYLKVIKSYGMEISFTEPTVYSVVKEGKQSFK